MTRAMVPHAAPKAENGEKQRLKKEERIGKYGGIGHGEPGELGAAMPAGGCAPGTAHGARASTGWPASNEARKRLFGAGALSQAFEGLKVNDSINEASP